MVDKKAVRVDRDPFESERGFRLLVEGVIDYAIYMLDPSGIVTNWNAGGQRIKGYLPQEIIGQHFSRFYTESDRASGKPARALEIARTQGRYEEEGWRVRKDGTYFWASVVVDPIRDDAGESLGFAKITRDITERREAQLKLERVQHQLAELQKMDAIGQLTGGVAHDFNNLLMIITGSIHALKKIAAGDARAERAAAAIEMAAQRGATLTRQLLTFSRRQNVNPVSIDVQERIASIRDVLNSGLGSAVELEISASPDAWRVTVDITEFETALLNLVINARDAMPDGGVVVINIRNVSDERGDHVEISVSDNGSGIAPDVLAKVFDPFFTTKPVGKGTGLGLSQVHGFAHQAGGTVAVESQLGKGTTVTISLPRAAVDEKTGQSTIRSFGAGVVLLVEDNPDVAEASTVLLEQLGYAVRWANCAEVALKEIEADDIDLVFSDIVMPGKLDGIGLARKIRGRFPKLPILLTTGYSEASIHARSEFPILRKPFMLNELGDALSGLSVTPRASA